MYIDSVKIEDFKCIGKAVMHLRSPSQFDPVKPGLRNINLILGDNGAGKTSLLRAIAAVVLFPVLSISGFLPYRMVRRAEAGKAEPARAVLNAEVFVAPWEVSIMPDAARRERYLKDMGLVAANFHDFPMVPEFISARWKNSISIGARLMRTENESLDAFYIQQRKKDNVISTAVMNDSVPGFFIVGYGATRVVETGGFSEGTSRKLRGRRYQQVASLFEDQYALRPLQEWLLYLSEQENNERFLEAVALINDALPDNVKFRGQFDAMERQYIFGHNGVDTPFPALSDGYKSFIGWVGDLVGRLVQSTPPGVPLKHMPGVVLVDEVDLHLHPEWQRRVLPQLAATFPFLQFIVTSHSALVASTVQRENIFVTGLADDGTSSVKQLQERTLGRGVEELLLSSYFGLQTVRPEGFWEDVQPLLTAAAAGDTDAALEVLARIRPVEKDDKKKRD